MNYKEYLLKQSAINLQYIAEKMWPTNKNARSYLSTKLNDTDPKRPWTAGDNEKAKLAINSLGVKLIEDAPISDSSIERKKVIKQKVTPDLEKEAPKRFNLAEELAKLKEPGAVKTNTK